MAPGTKMGVAWVLRPSGSDYQWISPDVIFFGAGDISDASLPSEEDDSADGLTIDWDSVTVVAGDMEEEDHPNELKFKWDWGSAYWTDRDGNLHEDLGRFEQVTSWTNDGVYTTDLRFEADYGAEAYLETVSSYELWAAFQAEGYQ